MSARGGEKTPVFSPARAPLQDCFFSSPRLSRCGTGSQWDPARSPLGSQLAAGWEAALGARVVSVLCGTDPGQELACWSAAEPHRQARREAGRACPHCSLSKPHILSGGCWLGSPTPPEPTGAGARRSAGGRCISHYPPAKSCLICASAGEQGCPACRPSAGYRELISLLGDKRLSAEGFGDSGGNG